MAAAMAKVAVQREGEVHGGKEGGRLGPGRGRKVSPGFGDGVGVHKSHKSILQQDIAGTAGNVVRSLVGQSGEDRRADGERYLQMAGGVQSVLGEDGERGMGSEGRVDNRSQELQTLASETPITVEGGPRRVDLMGEELHHDEGFDVPGGGPQTGCDDGIVHDQEVSSQKCGGVQLREQYNEDVNGLVDAVKNVPQTTRMSSHNMKPMSWSGLFAADNSEGKGMMRYVQPEVCGERKVARCPRLLVQENLKKWSLALVGQFVGRRLSYQVVRNIVPKLWKVIGNVDIHLLESGIFIFRFSLKEDRDRVLEGGPWFVQNRLMVVRPWEPETSLEKVEFQTVPVWIRLHGLPLHYWDSEVLSILGSVVGRPLAMDRKTMMEERLSFARLCVEIDARHELVSKIPVFDDEKLVFEQKVEYEWLPARCGDCGVFGHSKIQCIKQKISEGKMEWRVKRAGGVEEFEGEMRVLMGRENINKEVVDSHIVKDGSGGIQREGEIVPTMVQLEGRAAEGSRSREEGLNRDGVQVALQNSFDVLMEHGEELEKGAEVTRMEGMTVRDSPLFQSNPIVMVSSPLDFTAITSFRERYRKMLNENPILNEKDEEGEVVVEEHFVGIGDELVTVGSAGNVAAYVTDEVQRNKKVLARKGKQKEQLEVRSRGDPGRARRSGGIYIAS